MRLDGKRALITGAGGALGRATALKLAAEGAAVACCDLDESRAAATATAIHAQGGEALALGGDVAEATTCQRMIHQAAESLGGLDILFNNAGILLNEDAGPVDTPLDCWERTLAVNLTGVFLCCKYAIPHLQAAGGGCIINTASLVALVGSVFPQLAYTAAKGGVVSLSREIAVQYARQNIRCNALCPGPVRTPMTESFLGDTTRWQSRQAFIPAGRMGTPEEMAATVAFLASDDAAFINGAVIPVDGAISAAYVASNLEGRL